MPLIPRLVSLWRNLLRRGRVERELAEEIDTFLEMLTQAKVDEGLSPEEARRAALIELGGVEQVKESVREVRVGHFFRTAWQDFRYGARSLRKSPGFTVVAVVTLALGVGANTAVFSVVNAVLLRPLPYENPGQLVRLWADNSGRHTDRNQFSPAEITEFRDRLTTFEDVGLFDADGGQLVDVEEAAIIDLLGRHAPEGRAIRLGGDQRVEQVEATRVANHAIE